MKTVSIVIPTYNQAKYLPACVDHCLFQSYPNLEIIIVDGGSTDGTKNYLENLKHEISTRTYESVVEMDSRGRIKRDVIQVYPQYGRDIKIITFDKDIGATRTYNEGLMRVTGEFCTYIVGDDIPHIYMIEELVNSLEETGADFVYSDMLVIDDSGKIVRQMRMPDYSFEECFCRWYHIGVSHLYRSKWHRIVGLMDENYQCANDYDHYLRFAMAGAKFHHLPKILYSVRYHGKDRQTGQHTSIRYQKLLEESKRCACRARAWLEQKRFTG